MCTTNNATQLLKHTYTHIRARVYVIVIAKKSYKILWLKTGSEHYDEKNTLEHISVITDTVIFRFYFKL